MYWPGAWDREEVSTGDLADEAGKIVTSCFPNGQYGSYFEAQVSFWIELRPAVDGAHVARREVALARRDSACSASS